MNLNELSKDLGFTYAKKNDGIIVRKKGRVSMLFIRAILSLCYELKELYPSGDYIELYFNNSKEV